MLARFSMKVRSQKAENTINAANPKVGVVHVSSLNCGTCLLALISFIESTQKKHPNHTKKTITPMKKWTTGIKATLKVSLKKSEEASITLTAVWRDVHKQQRQVLKHTNKRQSATKKTMYQVADCSAALIITVLAVLFLVFIKAIAVYYLL